MPGAWREKHWSPEGNTECHEAWVLYRRGHTKLESTVQYLGIEVDDALEMAEQTEV
jgi:hypothetical protein